MHQSVSSRPEPKQVMKEQELNHEAEGDGWVTLYVTGGFSKIRKDQNDVRMDQDSPTLSEV